MKILGLTGRMGAGKDYLYTQLAKAFPWRVFRMAFADGVKLDIIEHLDIEDDMVLYAKPYKPEIRRLLQWWGTELRRDQDPDYWIKHVERRLANQAQFNEYQERVHRESIYVFTDVRFRNEAEWIKRQYGKVVNVWAPPEVRAERLGISVTEVEMLANHASESELGSIYVDLRVENVGGDYAALRLERFVTEWLTEG